MNKHYTLRAIALASVSVLPFAAAIAADESGDQPEYKSEVDVGAGYQNKANPFFDRYRGTDSGVSGLGGFSMRSKDAWDSGKTQYFEASGRNLDFNDAHSAPEASVNAKFGFQGLWGLNAYYDAITYTGNTINTPYATSGSNGYLVNGLLPYGGATTTAAGALTTQCLFTGTTAAGTPACPVGNNTANLAGLMIQAPTGTRRDIVGGGGSYRMGEWTISGNLRHEHKDGSLEQTFDGSASGTAFAEPINFDTDRYNLSAAYATRMLQATLSYTYSRFTDNIAGWSAPSLASGTSAPFQTASIYALPPSNDAHTFNGSVGYNVTSTTRLTGNFRVGLELQNQSIEPGTGTTAAQLTPATNGAATSANLALNPSSLSGQATVYGANFQVTSRPLSDLDLRAAYGIDGRDNDTSMYKIYGYGHGDGAVPGTYCSTAGSSVVTTCATPGAVEGVSFPQNWTKQNAVAEAGYRILRDSNTKVTVGYTFDDVDRSLAAVGHSQSSTTSAKVSSSPMAGLDGYVGIDHTVRSAEVHYWEPWTVLGNAATPSYSYPSVPFYQAPMVADTIKVRTNYVPNEMVSIGLFGRLTSDNYKYPGTTSYTTTPAAGTPTVGGWSGTTRDLNATIGPDVSYTPRKDVTVHSFYTFERIFYENHGVGAQPYNTNPPAVGNWSAATTDDVHTVGLSGEWKATEKLKLGTGYTFWYGDVNYALSNGVVLPVLPATGAAAYMNVQNLPHIPSSMHSFKVFGEYQLAPNMVFGAGYAFDMFKDNDWAYSAWAPAVQTSTTSGTLSTGVGAPSYRIHSLVTTLKVKF